MQIVEELERHGDGLPRIAKLINDTIKLVVIAQVFAQIVLQLLKLQRDLADLGALLAGLLGHFLHFFFEPLSLRGKLLQERALQEVQI